MHSKIKKILLVFTGMITLVIILIVAAFILVQTDGFKNKVKDTLLAGLNSSINAELHIARLGGNLYSTIILNDIKLINNNDTLATIRSIDVQYKLKELLKKHIYIQTLTIDSLYVNYKQSTDGGNNWNTSFTSQDKNKESDQYPIQPAWDLTAEQIRFTDGGLNAQFNDSLLCTRFKDFNLDATVNMIGDSLTGGVQKMTLHCPAKQINLHQFSFNFSGNRDSVDIRNINIAIDSTRINGNMQYNVNDQSVQQAALSITPLHLDLVQKFVALPLTLKTLNINANYDHHDKTHLAGLLVVNDQQSIQIQGNLLQDNDNYQYQISIQTSGIELQHWLDMPADAPITRVNSTVTIDGKGQSWQQSVFDFQTHIVNSTVYGQDIDNFTISGSKDHHNIQLAVDDRLDLAAVKFSGRAELQDTLRYQFELALSDLLLLQDEDTLNITLQNSGEWAGDFWQNRFTLGADSMHIRSIPIYQVSGGGFHSGESVKLDSLCIISALGDLDINGNMDFSPRFDFNYQFLGGNLAAILSTQPATFDGSIKGSIHGTPQSWSINGLAEIADIKIDSNQIKHARARFDYRFDDTITNADADIQIKAVDYAGIHIDSVGLASELQNEHLSALLAVKMNDNTQIHTRGSAVLADTLSILVDTLGINLSNQAWQLVNRPVSIEKYNNIWYIDRLSLNSGAQYIHLGGHISPDSLHNVNLKIDSLHIAPIASLFIPEHDLRGTLGAKFNLSGAITQPAGRGALNLDSLVIDQLYAGRLNGEFDLQNQQLLLDMDYQQAPGNNLTLQGNIPFSLSGTGPDTKKPKPVVLHAISKNLDLNFTNTLLPNSVNFSGLLSMDLDYTRQDSGNILNGSLQLTKGRVVNPEYNASLDNLDVNLQFDNNQSRLSLQSSKNGGTMTGKGDFTLSPQFKVSDMNLDFNLRNYKLASSRKLSLLANSDLRLTGDLSKPVLTGNANVKSARVYLPAFQGKNNGKIQGPILADKLESVQAAVAEKEKKNQGQINLETQIKLIFDRNIWVRNEDMNIELSGNLDIIRTGPDLFFFGEVNVVRGMLNLYGKRFEIDKGQITLQGNKEINPLLDIEAAHNFRDMYNEKHKLIVYITGNSNTPQIAFKLDEATIDQTNAVSYLLFGRGVNDLSYGEKKQMVENSGFLSSKGLESWFTSRLTAPITRSIRNRLELDVIEFKGGSDWRQASIILGKYITTDLYLSYIQEFNLGRSHELASEQISLEYELNRHLFLQATKGDDKTTGVDIVVKYEK